MTASGSSRAAGPTNGSLFQLTAGVDSGRRGVVSAAVNNRRDKKAEQKHKDLVQRLRQAVQRRLPER